MAHFNKTDLKEKKLLYVTLMGEYFDAMLEYNIYDGSEIQKQICDIIPINLLIDYNLDVSTWLKTGKNKPFFEKIRNEYNKLTDDEIYELMTGKKEDN